MTVTFCDAMTDVGVAMVTESEPRLLTFPNKYLLEGAGLSAEEC